MSFVASARLAALAAAGALALGTSALATTNVEGPIKSNSATLTVTGSVAAECTSLSNKTLSFSAYGPITDNSDVGSVSESIYCTNGASFTNTVTDSTKGSNCSAFAMTDGASTPHYLCYGLYYDSGYTYPVATSSFTGAGGTTPVSTTVYGKITPGQSSAYYGQYSDTVTFTISFSSP